MNERVSRSEGTPDIPVVDPAELAVSEPVPGLLVRTPFRIGERQMELLGVEERSGWHRRRGTVYGWVRAGSGRVDVDPDGADSVTMRSDEFFRVPPGVVHRYVAAEPLELLVVTEGEAVPTDPPADVEAGPAPAVAGPADLVPAVGSPNLVRETPFPGGDVLMMRVRATGGAAAGWHHHGENVYFGYAVDGPSETEYGAGGGGVARIEIGECFHVPPGLIHRDTNPDTETHTGIIWLCGGEPWVVNVDGPE